MRQEVADLKQMLKDNDLQGMIADFPGIHQQLQVRFAVEGGASIRVSDQRHGRRAGRLVEWTGRCRLAKLNWDVGIDLGSMGFICYLAHFCCASSICGAIAANLGWL